MYKFQDKGGRILYVGKANNLRKRLASYFINTRRSRRIEYMLSLATSVEWTCVANDLEALRLEQTWIRELTPLCNVKLKDDKAYPYLAVTLNETTPRVLITRRKILGAAHFGPYPKIFQLRKTVDLLQKSFQIRTCSSANYKRAITSGLPCFEGQIDKCFGPCSKKSTPLQYKKRINSLIKFLSGVNISLLSSLKQEMFREANKKNYEQAAILRDKIHAAEAILSRSAVILDSSVSGDFIAFASDDTYASIQCFRVAFGRIKSVHSWHFEHPGSQDDLLSQAIMQIYNRFTPQSRIVLNEKPDYLNALLVYLQEKFRDTPKTRGVTKGKSCAIEITYNPNEQETYLLEVVKDNAVLELERLRLKRPSSDFQRHSVLSELQKYLGLDTIPVRIECFDISHLAGTGTSGSMVVFENGEPKKSAYRRFNIEIDQNNDVASIFSLISRRLKSLASVSIDSWKYPNLLVIDGGKSQLSAALMAAEKTGVSISIVALAKKFEELWLPNRKHPVILPQNSEVLFLLQRIRDESHRFALAHQRKRRKSHLTTELFSVPGLGQRKAAALLRQFASFDELKRATIEDISALPGFGVKTAMKIKEYTEALSVN